MNAASSAGSRQRQSSHRRPSASRPITGRGNARSHADSASSALPPTVTAWDGSRSTGSAPEPIWLRHGSTATRRSGQSVHAPVPPAVRRRPDRRRRPGQQPQRRQLFRQPVRIQIEQQNLLQRRQPRLVQPQRPLQRIRVHALYQFRATDDQPGLRAAQQLVAGEAHEVGAAASDSCGVGSCGSPQAARSTRLPLPRSSTIGSPAAWAIAASSAGATAAVKPAIA